jgi:phosphatidylserine/phosphatidylglycerophosphate/cardiolipin synthase-like enzyme
VIRVYAYSLTDPYFIDRIIHHCKTKRFHVILGANETSIHVIKRVCSNFDAIKVGDSEPAKALLQSCNVIFRVVSCSQHFPETSVHMKGIVTDNWTLLGSYNFSMAARYKNWEQLLCMRTKQVDSLWFDALGAVPAGGGGRIIRREIDLWDYDQSPFRKKKKRPSTAIHGGPTV